MADIILPKSSHGRPIDAVVIGLELNPAEADNAVKALCTRILPGWQHLQGTDLEVSGHPVFPITTLVHLGMSDGSVALCAPDTTGHKC